MGQVFCCILSAVNVSAIPYNCTMKYQIQMGYHDGTLFYSWKPKPNLKTNSTKSTILPASVLVQGIFYQLRKLIRQRSKQYEMMVEKHKNVDWRHFDARVPVVTIDLRPEQGCSAKSFAQSGFVGGARVVMYQNLEQCNWLVSEFCIPFRPNKKKVCKNIEKSLFSLENVFGLRESVGVGRTWHEHVCFERYATAAYTAWDSFD